MGGFVHMDAVKNRPVLHHKAGLILCVAPPATNDNKGGVDR